MKRRLFDANVYLGQPIQALFEPAPTARALLKQMDASGIDRAIVWHVAQRDYSAADGNALVARAIKGESRLLGCWTILPPQTGEVSAKDFFARMRKQRIVALRCFPNAHNYLLNAVVFGDFLEEVTRRHIPLLLSMGDKGSHWPGVYALLKDYPELTCILCDIGIWSVNRYTWPLLQNYPNVHLETSLLSLEAGGVEATVEKYGAGRLIFGTGFPERYAESAVLQLMHSAIAEADKRKIAAGNMEQLIARTGL